MKKLLIALMMMLGTLSLSAIAQTDTPANSRWGWLPWLKDKAPAVSTVSTASGWTRYFANQVVFFPGIGPLANNDCRVYPDFCARVLPDGRIDAPGYSPIGGFGGRRIFDAPSGNTPIPYVTVGCSSPNPVQNWIGPIFTDEQKAKGLPPGSWGLVTNPAFVNCETSR
jgi:hypothetical protein